MHLNPEQNWFIIDRMTTVHPNSSEAFTKAYEQSKEIEDRIERVEKFITTYLKECNFAPPPLSHELEEADFPKAVIPRKQETPNSVLKKVYASVSQVLENIDNASKNEPDGRKKIDSIRQQFLTSMKWTHNVSVNPIRVNPIRMQQAGLSTPPDSRATSPESIDDDPFQDF